MPRLYYLLLSNITLYHIYLYYCYYKYYPANLLLEEFFDEFDYDTKANTIRFQKIYQVVKYVNGEKYLSSNPYKEKSDAVKDMLNTVASYASDHITHIEVDKDRVRLQTQDNVIAYQVEEV